MRLKILWRYFFAVLVFFLAPFLCAQIEEGNPAEDGAEPHYYRKISWTSDEYALRYEIVVEKETDGEYTEVLDEFTDTSFIELSLPQGQYRCRVIPYDYLDRPGEGSQWISFELYPLPDPVPAQPGEPPSTAGQIDNNENVAEKHKAPAVYIGFYFTPFLTVYGEENNFLDKYRSLSAAAFRLGFTVSRQDYLNIGLEITASWHRTAAHDVLGADLNLFAQKWFPNNTIALRIRAGAGIFLLPYKFDMENSLGEGFHINSGLSFIWRPDKHFFMELGADFSHDFSKDPPGVFQPFLGMGICF